MRHRRFGAVALAIFAVTLAGCAPAHVDPEDAQAWVDQVDSDVAAMPRALGSLSGSTGPAAVENMTENFTYAAPFPTVDAVRAGCFGAEGETATVTWTIRTASNWSGGGGGEITCDGTLQTLAAIGVEDGGYRDVNGVALSVTRDGDSRSYYAVIVGEVGEQVAQ